MIEDGRPEPDRIDGALHPRETRVLYGQDGARTDFLDAYTSGRLHHGWLITGPRGVGKATLAWAIARFLIATPVDDGGGLFGAPEAPTSLDIDPEHPVARRMNAGSEPGLFVLRRPYDEKAKRLKREITVEEARKLKGFFALSSADGGRRVVIVDAADELNVSAANAILKLLEEPPARTTLLLVSHQPSGLLPTIRSRCRELRLTSLGPDDITRALDQAGIEPPDQTGALATLAGGSVGEAVRLINLEGLPLYAGIIGILDSLPRLDRAKAQTMANVAAARGGEDRRDLMHHLLDLALARLARTGATGQLPGGEVVPGEAQVFARLAPNPAAARAWASVSQEIGGRLRHGSAVNLDPAALILDTFFRLQAIAGGHAA